MGDFKVDPAKLRVSSAHLSNQVAPGYADSATALMTKGHIDSPGFGIALSFLEAAYIQRLDFITLDVTGAHDVVEQIASRLLQTATEYERGENLNVAGFDGKQAESESYGAAFGSALGNSVNAGFIAGLLELSVISACIGVVESCGALCPTFIPAAIAAPLFVCNIPGIFHAGTSLINEASHLKGVLNAAFNELCSEAKAGWEGAGATDFSLLTVKIKSHMDELGEYINTIGSLLEALGVALTAFWVALIAMAGPFLVTLIAMRLAEASPPWLQDAVLEPIIEVMGALLGGSVLASALGLTTVGASVAALFSGIGGDVVKAFALPDGGKAGVPDMQEFHVNQNYEASL